MRIDWMRQVDRWIGGPLVVLVALIGRLGRRVRLPYRLGYGPNPPPATERLVCSDPLSRIRLRHPERPVIVIGKYFGLGSMVLAVPLLRAIRQRFPQARIVFVTFRANAGLMKAVPFVDETLLIRKQLVTFARDSLAALWRLRRLKPDVYVDLEFYSRYSALLAYASGSLIRVGFHTMSLASRGELLTHRVYLNSSRHAVDNFLALGEALGIEPRDRSLELRMPWSEAQQLDCVAKFGLRAGRYIVCSPHGEVLKQLKAYPTQQWPVLMDQLRRRTGLDMVWVGLKGDVPPSRTDVAAQDVAHDLTGKTDFQELMALLRHAAGVVSVDNGLVHLAAVFRVPTLVWFGPETPVLFRPLSDRTHVLYRPLHCSPCVNVLEGKQSDCRNNVCISQWSPEEVCDLAVEFFRVGHG